MRTSDEIEVEITDIDDGELILFELLLEQGWFAAARRVIEITKQAADEAERAGDEDRARHLREGVDIMWTLHCNFTFGQVDRLPVGLVSADLEYSGGEWTTARSLLAHTGYFGETEPGAGVSAVANAQPRAVTDGEPVEPNPAHIVTQDDIDIVIFSLMIEAGWLEAAPLAIEATECKWSAADESFDRERAGYWAETVELMRTTLECARLWRGEKSKTGLLSARLVCRNGFCLLCRGEFEMPATSEPGRKAEGDPNLN